MNDSFMLDNYGCNNFENSFQQSEKDIYRCPIYNRNLADLMAKIGDESTTMAILNNGTVMTIKMKSVVYTYNWNHNKNEFVIYKNKNCRKKKEFEGEISNNNSSESLNAKIPKDHSQCPIYNQNLADLMAKIGDESTTMAILSDGTVIAIKMKAIICSYNWNEDREEFVFEKNTSSRKKKNKIEIKADDCFYEEIYE